VHLRLRRREPGKDAAEPKCLVCELRPHPVVAGRRGIALVEDEVDDRKHRGEAGGERFAARHLERYARLGKRPLGADDALLDCRLRDEEGPGDLRDS
jgi:hypothetical protein